MKPIEATTPPLHPSWQRLGQRMVDMVADDLGIPSAVLSGQDDLVATAGALARAIGATGLLRLQHASALACSSAAIAKAKATTPLGGQA